MAAARSLAFTRPTLTTPTVTDGPRGMIDLMKMYHRISRRARRTLTPPMGRESFKRVENRHVGANLFETFGQEVADVGDGPQAQDVPGHVAGLRQVHGADQGLDGGYERWAHA